MKLPIIAIWIAASSWGCAPNTVAEKALDSTVGTTFAHKAEGTYNATVTSGGSTNTFNDSYALDYTVDAANAITGRHNFLGLASGYKKIAGTKNGNTFTYHSIECQGDSFNGTFDTTNGAGTFSGTVCGYDYSGGLLVGMSITK